MDFFSKDFFQWLGTVASIFLIIIGVLNIPVLSLWTKIIVALIFSLIFLVAILVFIIVEFKVRDKNIITNYTAVYNYALSLESSNQELQNELLNTQQSLSNLHEYAMGLASQNNELNQKIGDLTNALQRKTAFNLYSPLKQMPTPPKFGQ